MAEYQPKRTPDTDAGIPHGSTSPTPTSPTLTSPTPTSPSISMHERTVQKLQQQVDALTVRVQKIADSLALLTQMTAKAPSGETLIAIVQEIRQRVQMLPIPPAGMGGSTPPLA